MGISFETNSQDKLDQYSAHDLVFLCVVVYLSSLLTFTDKGVLPPPASVVVARDSATPVTPLGPPVATLIDVGSSPSSPESGRGTSGDSAALTTSGHTPTHGEESATGTGFVHI